MRGIGDNMSSVNESIAFWVEHNGCNPTPEIYTSASGKIIRRTYTNGEKGTEVILYTTVGGDHWWPGNPILQVPWLLILFRRFQQRILFGSSLKLIQNNKKIGQ